MANSNRILVKVRASCGVGAAASKVNLRPLHARPPQVNAFGISDAPEWYLADLPDTDEPNPWDLRHARVADQLGVDESAVLFAEPDLDQRFTDVGDPTLASGAALAAAPAGHTEQDGGHGKVTGPSGAAPTFGWHLGDDYTQLKAARDAVHFSPPRTRIAHIDTGYDRTHVAKPDNIVL